MFPRLQSATSRTIRHGRRASAPVARGALLDGIFDTVLGDRTDTMFADAFVAAGDYGDEPALRDLAFAWFTLCDAETQGGDWRRAVPFETFFRIVLFLRSDAPGCGRAKDAAPGAWPFPSPADAEAARAVGVAVVDEKRRRGVGLRLLCDLPPEW